VGGEGLVSVGMPLVVNTGFRFERISSVLGGFREGPNRPKVVARVVAQKAEQRSVKLRSRAEGGGFLNRFGGPENLRRGFESLPLRQLTSTISETERLRQCRGCDALFCLLSQFIPCEYNGLENLGNRCTVRNQTVCGGKAVCATDASLV
jgi:hypothetical protein